MDIDFRNKLLSLVTDPVRRAEIEKIENVYRFIESLAWYIREETARIILQTAQEKPDEQKSEGKNIFNFVQDLSSDASATAQNAFAYAYLLFLADLYFQPWATIWLKEVADKYPEVVPLRYIFALSLSFARIFDKSVVADSAIDPLTVMFNAVRENPETIIYLWNVHSNIIKQYFQTYPAISSYAYNILKNSYPRVSPESFHNALTSVNLTILADYNFIAGKKMEAEKNVADSLSLWSENSYALALLGNSELEKGNFKLARKKLLKAEGFAEIQFNGLPIKNRTLITIYLNLSYLLYKDGLYEKSIEYCNKALRLNPEPLLKVIVLLNRGRTFFEKGDIDDAYSDFTEACDMETRLNLNLPEVASIAHNNMGLIYYDRGLYEKAKSEYNLALSLKQNLPEAYNNLGIIYYDEGQRERAKKLFGTACTLNPDFDQAKTNLKKLEPAGGLDWWDWWFGIGGTVMKRIVGGFLMVLLLSTIALGMRMVFWGKDVPTSLLGIMGIIIVILILPWIKKLEVGPLKLEGESKGKGLYEKE